MMAAVPSVARRTGKKPNSPRASRVCSLPSDGRTARSKGPSAHTCNTLLLKKKSMFDVARNRRRFYLDRAIRKRPIGSGSDLEALMRAPRRTIAVKLSELFSDIPWCVVGGVAARAYMPERTTEDIDILVEHPDFDNAEGRLSEAGWARGIDLFFPNASLGLYGSAWSRGGVHVDILSSSQPWVHAALLLPQHDQTGLRVIPLAYLVLMKVDSARAVDQGDLARMLGPIGDDEVNRIAEIVTTHSHDPQAAEDVHQYAQLGRWELQTPERTERSDKPSAT